MGFDILGYFLECHVNGKFIGTINLPEIEEGREIGYIGKQTHTATETLVMTNNKKIKKGTVYNTYMYPLCGKRI